MYLLCTGWHFTVGLSEKIYVSLFKKGLWIAMCPPLVNTSWVAVEVAQVFIFLAFMTNGRGTGLSFGLFHVIGWKRLKSISMPNLLLSTMIKKNFLISTCYLFDSWLVLTIRFTSSADDWPGLQTCLFTHQVCMLCPLTCLLTLFFKRMDGCFTTEVVVTLFHRIS